MRVADWSERLKQMEPLAFHRERGFRRTGHGERVACNGQRRWRLSMLWLRFRVFKSDLLVFTKVHPLPFLPLRRLRGFVRLLPQPVLDIEGGVEVRVHFLGFSLAH